MSRPPVYLTFDSFSSCLGQIFLARVELFFSKHESLSVAASRSDLFNLPYRESRPPSNTNRFKQPIWDVFIPNYP